MLCFLVAVEVFCRTRTFMVQRKAEFEEKKARTTVLVLGDSHALNAVTPRLFDTGCASLALGGQPLVMDYYLLERYAPTMPMLKMVLLDVSPPRFYHRITPESWNARLYRIVYGIEYGTEAFSPGNYSFVMADVRHCSALFLHHMFSVVFHTITGESHLNAGLARKAMRGAGYMGRYPEMPADSAAAWLYRIAGYCQAHHIELVLFESPVFGDSDQFIPGRLGATSEIIEDVATRYGLLLFNHRTDTVFSASDFRDETHLNSTGASKFTKMLREEYVLGAAGKVEGEE